jgi:hypothetical protein
MWDFWILTFGHMLNFMLSFMEAQEHKQMYEGNLKFSKLV